MEVCCQIEVSEASLYWTQNIASSHVYSGFRMAVCPLKNTHWAKWNLHTVENRKKLPPSWHVLKSHIVLVLSFETYFSLFLLLIESNFPRPCYDAGLQRTSYGVRLFLTSSVPLWLWHVHLPKSGLTCCFASSIHAWSQCPSLVWIWCFLFISGYTLNGSYHLPSCYLFTVVIIFTSIYILYPVWHVYDIDFLLALCMYACIDSYSNSGTTQFTQCISLSTKSC